MSVCFHPLELVLEAYKSDLVRPLLIVLRETGVHRYQEVSN